jgi:hypothetical protein
MPSQEYMTWSAKQKRWFKKYGGMMFSISPRQLRCSPTKDDSRQTANQWWEAKLKQLDEEQAAGKRHRAPIREAYEYAIHQHLPQQPRTTSVPHVHLFAAGMRSG